MDKHNLLGQFTHSHPVDLLFVGDSITEWWLTEGLKIWNKDYQPRRAANIGIAGDTTQDVYWRLSHGEIDNLSPRAAVLMIGTNDISFGHPEAVVPGIERILQLMHAKMPRTKILLLGLFPRDFSANSQVRSIIKDINGQLKHLCSEINRNSGGPYVFYLDISNKFLRPDGSLIADAFQPDGLHLAAHGYEIWAEAMQPELDKLMPR